MPNPSHAAPHHADLIGYAAGRLTHRDRTLAGLLFDNQVLTTNQITDIGFDTPRRAQRRLLQLHRMRIVERVRPFVRSGSAPFHWILDTVGAEIVAIARESTVEELGWRRDRSLAVLHSARLPHLLGVNDLLTGLLRWGRHHPDCALESWWPERRCAAAVGAYVRPDAYGVWREGAAHVRFYLEHDRGTEQVSRVADKLDDYLRLSAATQPTTIALRLPSAGRERSVRRAIAHHPAASHVLTSHEGAEAGGPVWLNAADTDTTFSDRRRTLGDAGR